MPESKENVEYPDNSYKAQEEALELEANNPNPAKTKFVPTGTIIKKKETWASKLKDTFFGSDANSVMNFVLYDVLVPAAKATINDVITSGIERLLYGESSRSPNSSRRERDSRPYISYNRYSDDPRDRPIRRDRGTEIRPVSGRSRFRFDDLVFSDHRDAQAVLDKMQDYIDDYKVVSVADLYEIMDMTGDHTDNRWGWETMSRSAVRRVRDGYVLDLPDPRPIEN